MCSSVTLPQFKKDASPSVYCNPHHFLHFLLNICMKFLTKNVRNIRSKKYEYRWLLFILDPLSPTFYWSCLKELVYIRLLIYRNSLVVWRYLICLIRNLNSAMIIFSWCNVDSIQIKFRHSCWYFCRLLYIVCRHFSWYLDRLELSERRLMEMD